MKCLVCMSEVEEGKVIQKSAKFAELMDENGDLQEKVEKLQARVRDLKTENQEFEREISVLKAKKGGGKVDDDPDDVEDSFL